MTTATGATRSRFPRDSSLGHPGTDHSRGKRDRQASASAAWRRDFRRLWLGETASSLGSSVTVVALPLVAISLHASVATIGLLGAAAWLPWLLIGHGTRLACFIIGIGVIDAGIVAGNVISAGFTQQYCPVELFGRISTSMQVVNFGTIPLGAVLGGALGGAVGTRATLWAMLTLFVASGAIILASPFRGRRGVRDTDVGGHLGSPGSG